MHWRLFGVVCSLTELPSLQCFPEVCQHLICPAQWVHSSSGVTPEELSETGKPYGFLLFFKATDMLYLLLLGSPSAQKVKCCTIVWEAIKSPFHCWEATWTKQRKQLLPLRNACQELKTCLRGLMNDQGYKSALRYLLYSSSASRLCSLSAFLQAPAACHFWNRCD